MDKVNAFRLWLFERKDFPLGVTAGLVLLHFIEGFSLLDSALQASQVTLASAALAFLFVVGATSSSLWSIRQAFYVSKPENW